MSGRVSRPPNLKTSSQQLLRASAALLAAWLVAITLGPAARADVALPCTNPEGPSRDWAVVCPVVAENSDYWYDGLNRVGEADYEERDGKWYDADFCGGWWSFEVGDPYIRIYREGGPAQLLPVVAAASVRPPLICAGEDPPPPPRDILRVMTPDFLESSWQQPLECLDLSMPGDVVLEVHPPDTLLAVLLDHIQEGNPPDLALVSDGWLEALDQDGHIEHLSLEDAYFPVVVDREIVGVRLPWAHQWTAIIPASSLQKPLSLEMLQHACIWERPVDLLEEYQAFGELLAEDQYELVWEDASVIYKELGGIPVEITVVPTTVQDDKFFQLIIARDERGKTFAQTQSRPASERDRPGDLAWGTGRTIQDGFVFSSQWMATLSDDRPGYCTRAEDCLDPEVIECLSNPPGCLFEWISGLLSSAELARLRQSGRSQSTAPYNSAYAWGSKLRAWKLYNAMLTQDNYHYKKRAINTAARVQNDITYDSGFTLTTGFTLRGVQTLSVIPTGHMWWWDSSITGMLTQPRVAIITDNLRNLTRCGNSIYIVGPGLEGISSACDDDEDPPEDDIFDDFAIDIDWEMDYDADTNILSVEYSASGEACYGIYEICEICVVGGGEAHARAELDGTEVHLELKLEAYVEGNCGIHPCAHATTGGGIGIHVDITYPNECTAKVTTTIEIGWGGHGDALNIKAESCDTVELAGPSGFYDICGDPAVQDELSTYDEFVTTWGSWVGGEQIVDAAAIERALDCYELPATAGSYSDIYDPGGENIPGSGTISLPHRQMELPISPFVVVPPSLTLGEPCDAVVSMEWVEDLAGGYYYISYNPEVMTTIGVSGGQMGYVEIPATWQQLEPGLIMIEHSIPSPEGVTGAGYLAQVHFVTHSPGQSLIEFVDGDLYDTEGGEIAADWIRGYTTVRLNVEIDIRPGTEPNYINLWSEGVVPVAIITTEDFDAGTVDPDKVGFAGALASSPSLEDVDGDADLDMLLSFVIEDLHLVMGSTTAILAGETLDGIKVIASDSVVVYITDGSEEDCNGNGVPDESESAASDITAEGSFVGTIFSLSPPHPLGIGNRNPEIMRDGDYPPIGSEDTLRQYDTFHEGDQGDEDWMGYEFAETKMFRSIIFQEGIHFWDGGWFDGLQVQVRSDGVWSDVAGLEVNPPYPGDNNVNYDTFRLTFEPVEGDAIRIYGNPGGSADFISIGELRVIAGMHPTFDCNDNGVLDECDVADGTSDDYDLNGVPDECEDCTGNGIPDACDADCAVGDCASHPLGCGGYVDCNGNLIPDQCIPPENDCNGNGTPDDCDIADGFSVDYDLNGVPDECEDCNGNGVPDGCDLDCAAGSCADYYPDGCGGSGDCNRNGVPDECDIAEGTSDDCNGNGYPDECELSRFPIILTENTTGMPNSIFTGPPDDVCDGIGGQIVTYDFGAFRVVDLDGPDFNVYEQDFDVPEFDTIDVLVSADGIEFVSVEVSEGPVLRIPGDEAHSDDDFARSYDLGPAGLSAARYVRLDGDEDGPAGGYRGFDLDAIAVINFFGDCNGDGVPNECDCRGDLDGDCDIDLSDLAQLLSRYGITGGAQYQDGDLDLDGDVDLTDLAALLAAYGTSCP